MISEIPVHLSYVEKKSSPWRDLAKKIYFSLQLPYVDKNALIFSDAKKFFNAFTNSRLERSKVNLLK